MNLFESPKKMSQSVEELYEGLLTLLEGLPGPSSGAYPYTRKYSIEEDTSLFHETKPVYGLIRLYLFELFHRTILTMKELEENFDLNQTQEDSPNRSILLEKDAVCSKCFEAFRMGDPIVLVPTNCRLFAHGKITSFMMCGPCSLPYGPYHKNDERVITEEVLKELEWMNYNLMWRDSKEILLPLLRSKYRHLLYVKRTMTQMKETLE